MAVPHFVILSVLFAAAVAEVTTFSKCRGVSEQHCSVSQVRITPCAKKGNCALQLGSNASLAFDFTPNFSTSKLQTMVYSQGTQFPGFGDPNGCLYTTCPTTSGVSQTFNYGLHIGAVLPKGTYSINWKVWNEDNADEVCCFVTKIKLVKAS